MRPIKFRAWIHDEDSEDPKLFMTHNIAFEQFEPINDLLSSVNNLMQFTGLLDKNGREIYEGDILSNIGTRNHSVIFFEGRFCEMWHSAEYINSECRGDGSIMRNGHAEVIGNVWENPELLEAK